MASPTGNTALELSSGNVDRSEWDYCGYCGRELIEVMIPSDLATFQSGDKGFYVVARCPTKSFWHPKHDEFVIKAVEVEEPMKFDRRTGRRK